MAKMIKRNPIKDMTDLFRYDRALQLNTMVTKLGYLPLNKFISSKEDGRIIVPSYRIRSVKKRFIHRSPDLSRNDMSQFFAYRYLKFFKQYDKTLTREKLKKIYVDYFNLKQTRGNRCLPVIETIVRERPIPTSAQGKIPDGRLFPLEVARYDQFARSVWDRRYEQVKRFVDLNAKGAYAIWGRTSYSCPIAMYYIKQDGRAKLVVQFRW